MAREKKPMPSGHSQFHRGAQAGRGGAPRYMPPPKDGVKNESKQKGVKDVGPRA